MFCMYYAFNFNLLLFINVFEQLSRCTDIFDIDIDIQIK